MVFLWFSYGFRPQVGNSAAHQNPGFSETVRPTGTTLYCKAGSEAWKNGLYKVVPQFVNAELVQISATTMVYR